MFGLHSPLCKHRSFGNSGRGCAKRAQLELEALESRTVPTVTYHGGPLLGNVEVETVFIGSDWYYNSNLYQQTGLIRVSSLIATPR
jgi:hypothetical protein